MAEPRDVAPSTVTLRVQKTTALRQLAINLRQAPKRIQMAAAREIQAEVAKQIDQGFQTKSDPYGSKWLPPKDGNPTMERTGALRRGFVVRVVSNGVGLSLEITNREDYAKWLQAGTSKMVPRKMVPDRAIPAEWKEIFTRAYDKAIEAWYATVKY